jgi:hypothetical protein
MVSQLRTSTTAEAPSLGRLPDSPLPELLHGDGYKIANPESEMIQNQ